MDRSKRQWKHDNSNLLDAVKSVIRGKFITIQAYLKKQEISNKQPNLTPKATRKRRTKKKIPKLIEWKKS